MYDILNKVHNINRWIICVALIYVLFKLITGAKDQGLRKAALLLLITSHIQLLIGLYQYFFGPFGMQQISNATGGMKEIMGTTTIRYWVVEHFTTMLIAIVLITMAYSNIKKSVLANVKPKKALWLLIIAMILIIAGMPWPMREGIARTWLPI
jgi:hypothetical protein